MSRKFSFSNFESINFSFPKIKRWNFNTKLNPTLKPLDTMNLHKAAIGRQLFNLCRNFFSHLRSMHIVEEVFNKIKIMYCIKHEERERWSIVKYTTTIRKKRRICNKRSALDTFESELKEKKEMLMYLKDCNSVLLMMLLRVWMRKLFTRSCFHDSLLLHLPFRCDENNKKKKKRNKKNKK